MSKSDYFVVRKGATAVPNSLIHNKDLSYQALALALVSLSMPVGAKVGYRQLAGRGLGESATRKALAELEEHNLRFRFRTRTKGKIRDVTIMSDEPLTVAQARDELLARISAQALSERTVLQCVSHTDDSERSEEATSASQAGTAPEQSTANIGATNAPHGPRSEAATSAVPAGDQSASTMVDSPTLRPVDNYRAAAGTARCDQRKRSPVDNPKEQGADLQERSVSAGRTVQWSTVARSDAAHITKVISKSSLRSDNSNQTKTGDDSGLVGALPESMWSVLGASARARVIDSIESGLAAGWTSAAIKSRIEANPLPPPEMIRNIEGLIISRVRAVVDSPPPAISVKRTAEEIARDRLADCYAIIDGTCELSPKQQVLLANAAIGDRLIEEHIEITQRAFKIAQQRYSAAHNSQVSGPVSTFDRDGGENSRAGSGQTPALRDVAST